LIKGFDTEDTEEIFKVGAGLAPPFFSVKVLMPNMKEILKTLVLPSILLFLCVLRETSVTLCG
jgi:hypothetical protein